MSLRKYFPNIIGIIISLILVIPFLRIANENLNTSITIPYATVRDTYENNVEISKWIKVPRNSVGFVMNFENHNKEGLEIEIQSLMNNGELKDWEELDIDDDLESAETHFPSHIFFSLNTNKIRYKVKSNKLLEGHLFWLLKEGSDSTSFLPNIFKTATAKQLISIITRKEWGADESIRFIDPNNPPPEEKFYVKVDPEFLKEFSDELEITKTDTFEDGKKLIWPINYAKKVTKIVLHHSAGRTPSCSEEKSVLRAIYKYHTVSRGWGDIGYHYIVGACSGKIYEGRAGEFGSVGAHVAKHNTGSVGVMIMGNFQNNDLSSNTVNTISNLVRFLAETFNIDPTGHSSFRGKDIPNIIGHRDLGNTTCPGQHIYENIEQIRQIAKSQYVAPSKYYGKDIINSTSKTDFSKSKYDAIPFSANTNDLFLKPNAKVDLTLMFKNTGRENWSPKTFLRIDGNTDGLSFGSGKSQSNIAFLNEESVNTGHLGTFNVSINVSNRPSKKEYSFEIIPVINGKSPAYDGALPYRIVINNDTGVVSSSVASDIQANYHFHDVAPVQKIFSDISSDDEFFPYIKDLINSGAVNGKRVNFNPEQTVSRSEFAKMVSISADLNTDLSGINYKDVPLNNSFYEYIKKLRGNNIVSKNEYFRPNNPVSRGEAIKIIVNAFNLTGSDNHLFHDLKDTIFEPYAQIASHNEVINKNTLFYPDNYLTREQAAKIISIAKLKSNKEIATPGVTKTFNSNNLKANFIPESSYGTYGPNVRTEVGFESDIVKINGSNSNYDIYSENKFFAEINNDHITTIKYENGKYVAYTVTGTYESFNPIRLISKHTENGVLKITNWIRPQNEYGGRQDIRFRNILEIRYDKESKKLYVINELPLEKYLWGLGEEPNGMPTEKNKTIATLARSYAYYYATSGGKHPERFSHLISNGNDQVYRGYDYEKNHQEFVKSVKETQGEMVFYKDVVIKSPFFSRSDGKTKEAGKDGNPWNFEKFPYSQSVDDPWSCGGSSADIGKNLRCPDQSWGHGVGVSAKGAEGMAKEGKNYKEIIEYFYKDVSVHKGY